LAKKQTKTKAKTKAKTTSKAQTQTDTTTATGPHWFPFSWAKRSAPLLGPNPHHFVSRNIYEPSVLFDGNTNLMLFRGESRHEPPTSCIGRLGIGLSKDGIQFECRGEPALVPDAPYEAYGLAHPRLTLAGGVFILTYSAYDGARYRLCLATSTDLVHWFRHGPIFPEFEEKQQSTSSGSILPQASKDGRYFMYVGAGDLYLASSTDLVEWELDPKPVLTRKDCPVFAGKSMDPGPSPFVTEHGVVLILNATDRRNHTRVFAALFDAENPAKCMAHLKKPCLSAESDWEKFGYMPNVVRATGLALRDGEFRLYYSGADRFIGMATAPVPQDYLPDEAKQDEAIIEKAESKPKVCGV
jgi:predicted GH43/DUF377 family glycosyl hydrolase